KQYCAYCFTRVAVRSKRSEYVLNLSVAILIISTTNIRQILLAVKPISARNCLKKATKSEVLSTFVRRFQMGGLFVNILHAYFASFKGLSKEAWMLSIVMLINRTSSMVLPFLGVY